MCTHGGSAGRRGGQQKMKIVVLANNTCEGDARIIRSAEAAAHAGHRVIVLARGAFGLPRKIVMHGVTYERAVNTPVAKR